MKIPLLCLVASALGGCSTVSGDVARLEGQVSTCCASLAELPFRDAVVGQYVPAVLDESAPTSTLPFGKSYIAPYRLPEKEISKLVMKADITSNGLAGTIVCPWVTFLDASHLPLGYAETATLHKGSRMFDSHYLASVNVPQGARYALVHTHFQSVGQRIATAGIVPPRLVIMGSASYMAPGGAVAMTPPCSVRGNVAVLVR